jgi:hypothetical protein
MRRTSYQQGSLKLAERKKGKVWEFRWSEVQIDRWIRRKNIVIGSLEEFPNKSSVQAAVDALRLEINQQTPQQLIKSIYLEILVITTGSTNCQTYSIKPDRGQMQRTKIASRTRRR